MDLSIDSLAQHLPRYLSATRQEGIRKALADFPDIKVWYLNAYADEVLQGDCWSHLTALHFDTGARKKIRGVVLSNSCDIDPKPSKAPQLPMQIVFVPLLRLEALKQHWSNRGFEAEAISQTLDSIRRQSIDSFIYFPAGASIVEESVAWLDQVHTMPFDRFAQEGERRKLSTLHDVSFYLFAFKLSIYFCRLHEGVDRSSAAEPAPTDLH
jgi:hypothetical protein